MGEIIEKDFLWEVLRYIKIKYKYEAKLVISYKSHFNNSILIFIPINKNFEGYISICAVDFMECYKKIGEKETYKLLDKTIQDYIEKMNKKVKHD